MTMIELPLATRSLKTVQERVTKPQTGAEILYGHHKEEVSPQILEIIPGERRSLTVSAAAVHGIREAPVKKIGVRVRRIWSDLRCHDVPEHGPNSEMHPSIHELRSQILLADGKRYEIDMGYHALLVLIAGHVRVDTSAMPPP